MKENWYALLIAILKCVTLETAFSLLGINMSTQEDKFDMLKLKEKLTYKKLSEIYGITDKAVSMRVSRCRAEIKNELKEYLELAEGLYNRGFTIREVIDLITDMVKAEQINLKQAV